MSYLEAYGIKDTHVTSLYCFSGRAKFSYIIGLTVLNWVLNLPPLYTEYCKRLIFWLKSGIYFDSPGCIVQHPILADGRVDTQRARCLQAFCPQGHVNIILPTSWYRYVTVRKHGVAKRNCSAGHSSDSIIQPFGHALRHTCTVLQCPKCAVQNASQVFSFLNSLLNFAIC